MKQMKLFLTGLLIIVPVLTTFAQRAMTVEDLREWKRITKSEISNDGLWAAAVFSQWKGDTEVQLYSADGKQTVSYPLGSEVKFSSSSDYALIKLSPAEADVEVMKLKKAKKDEMPLGKLTVRNLSSGDEWTVDSLKSFKLAESAGWVAYQTGRKDSILHVSSLDGLKKYDLPNVSDYAFAKKSASLYFVTKDTAQIADEGLYLWSPESPQPTLVKKGDGSFPKLAFDEQGDKLAFLYTEKSDKHSDELSLWLSESAGEARQLLRRDDEGMYEGWVISPNADLEFSKDASRIFFGTAPKPLQKDTTLLDENRPNVQVWSWDEPVQYTVQNYNVKKDLKKSYTAVFHLNDKKMVQLADTLLPDISKPKDGSGDYALISTNLPYMISSMWEGRVRTDYYSVSLLSGERRELSLADNARMRISPAGKYAYGYNETDSCWYTFDMATAERCRLTSPDTFEAWDSESDTPDFPRSYGSVGWTNDDERLLLLDRYDIWSFSPKGEGSPVRLTTDGRENLRQYRRIAKLDPEIEYVDITKTQLVGAFDETTKVNSVYSTDLSKPKAPKIVAGGDFNYNVMSILKAKDAERILFTKENFETFPDIHISDLNFKNPVRLSDGIKQQEEFIWGTAELIEWTSLDGVKLQGVIYKPSDFNPERSYPMIVNFYERNSETLNKYHTPETHRSTIDYHLYLSNGYVIFNPDIRYSRDGFPGEDCYNCLMPGIAAVVAQGYVDTDHIGAQGHSWGGYQTAYLATRTNLFAAIESGAPVVNMFSAYGGIRWGSGMARSFQYEHGQSRIGGTPWDATLRYFENSPLFFMDKVHTPILIMHNDADGHVPWYQGIEFFVAMKRFGHPVWLLNYTGEPHWPLKAANKEDFQLRMFQFFNHFLKDEPMPKWMSKGVRAVEQPFELGY